MKPSISDRGEEMLQSGPAPRARPSSFRLMYARTRNRSRAQTHGSFYTYALPSWCASRGHVTTSNRRGDQRFRKRCVLCPLIIVISLPSVCIAVFARQRYALCALEISLQPDILKNNVVQFAVSVSVSLSSSRALSFDDGFSCASIRP